MTRHTVRERARSVVTPAAVADEVTLFDKIVAGTIPSDRVYEDDVVSGLVGEQCDTVSWWWRWSPTDA